MTVVGPHMTDPHELRRADAELFGRTRHMQRSIEKTTGRASRRKEGVGKAAEDLQRGRSVAGEAAADADNARSLRARLPRTGHAADSGRHGMPLWLYLLVLALAGVGAWLVDQGSLLVLELPLVLTQAIALSLVLVKLLAAHWGGHVRRRCHQSVHARLDVGRTEIGLGWACIIGGYALALAVAAVRTISGGGVWTGVIFALLGVLDFTVALVASYVYANDTASAHDQARRRATRKAKYATYDYKLLLRHVARWRAACVAVVSAAAAVVAEAEAIREAGLDNYRRNHPGEIEPVWDEPSWLDGVRSVAHGNLPPHLDIRPLLTAAGIDPDEVL